jgi:hypothetical protein
MNTNYCIELSCRKTDAFTFARLGFTPTATTEPANALETARMRHPDLGDAIVTTLVALRIQGKRFTARIVEMNCPLVAQEVML